MIFAALIYGSANVGLVRFSHARCRTGVLMVVDPRKPQSKLFKKNWHQINTVSSEL
jgi:hypothetical protein